MSALIRQQSLNNLIKSCSTLSIRKNSNGILLNNNASNASKITICPKEMKLFNELSSIWWEEEGPMKLLHKMIPVRIEILKHDLHKAKKINLDTADPRKPFEGLNVLEVGCGGGLLSESIAKLGAKVVGVDAAQEILKVAIDHLDKDPELSENLTYVNETIEDFSLNHRDHFDVMIASEVIEHVADKDSFAKFSIDCLRPGGSVFFTTMNRTPLSGIYYIFLMENFFNAIPKGAHEYEKFMRPEEMSDMFKRYKCKPTDVQGFTANVLTYNWFKVPFHTFNFSMHAIKET